jgi:hypothetical protein
VRGRENETLEGMTGSGRKGRVATYVNIYFSVLMIIEMSGTTEETDGLRTYFQNSGSLRTSRSLVG